MTPNQKVPFRPTDSRRHLIPALYNWMLENDSQVHLHLLATWHGMSPSGMAAFRAGFRTLEIGAHREDGSAYPLMRQDVLQLNISPEATGRVYFSDEYMEIDLRMQGKPITVFAPYGAIVALFVPDPEKLATCSFAFPFLEADLLSNGVAALSDASLPENVTAVKFGKQPQAQAAGAEVEPPQDQTPLDFSIKPEKKRPSHLSLVK